MKTGREPGGSGLGMGLGLGAEAGGQDQGAKTGQEPSDAAKARFEQLLAGESEEARARALRAGYGPAPAEAAARVGPAGPAGAPAPRDGAALGQLVEEVAERVLVSDSRFDARQEIRIKVKDTVFPGLEVRLRQEDGRLVVELVAAQSGDLALLRREAVRLLQGLRERLGREVEMRFSTETADGKVSDAGSETAAERGDTLDPGPAGERTLPRGPAG